MYCTAEYLDSGIALSTFASWFCTEDIAPRNVSLTALHEKYRIVECLNDCIIRTIVIVEYFIGGIAKNIAPRNNSLLELHKEYYIVE